MSRFSLIPLFLCFALTAQAWASAEHIHLNHAAEVECQVCGSFSDLAPAEKTPVLAVENQFVPQAVLPLQIAQARPVRRCPRAPPVQL